MLPAIVGILLVVIVLAFGYLCRDYHQHRWPVKNFPPGPYGWPMLGSPIMMRPQVHLEFEELCQKYGNVFSMALGQFAVVVVNGQEAIKEALMTNMNATAGRGDNYVQTLYNPELKGIIEGLYCESWRRQRHFTHTALRSFGFGKASFEEKVMVEVDEALDKFKEMVGKPFYPLKIIAAATTSIICTVTMGVRFNFNDDKFLRVSDVSNNWFTTMYRSHALNAFPFIRPFSKKLKDNVKEAYEGLAGFVREEIKNHEATFEKDEEPRDFIDCYLSEIQNNPELYTREELIKILIDLYLGGNETSTLLLTFALLHMIRNPEIQEKVHQEIVEKVGYNRLPNMKDMDDLPYTVAVVKELIRHNSQTPLVNRSAVTDFTLAGYNIPKGTELMINLWSLHRNSKAWPNPDKFNPDRFLGMDKADLIADGDNFLPFGAGRKVCMGKHLAKMELLLFFSCMMYRFKFSAPPGYDVPPTTGTTKFLIYPPYYELMVTPRF